MRKAILFAAVSLAAGSGIAASGAAAPPEPTFTLTSTSFQDGGLVPMRMAYTKDDKNPNCFGQNVLLIAKNNQSGDELE